MKHVRTTNTLPRDYGLQIRLAGEKPVFVSPSRYAMAALLLDDAPAQQARLASYSQRHDEPFDDLQTAFEKGVRFRFKSDALITNAGEGALDNVRRYGNFFTATVASKSNSPSHAVQMRIHDGGMFGPAYVGHDCKCEDDFWNEVKGSKGIDAVCSHAAALEIALAHDNLYKRLSAANNVTGLKPKARAPPVELPFQLNYQCITDLAISYLAKRVNHFTINADLLADIALLSGPSEQRLKAGTAQFIVLAQKAQTVDEEKLSHEEKKYFAAVRGVEQRIGDALRFQGFTRDGYSLAFKGTAFETIAKRWSRSNVSYEFCPFSNLPPVLVRKIVANYDGQSATGLDMREDLPHHRGLYAGVDDATRRHAQTKVMLPTELEGVFVADVLKQSYQALKP